MTEQQLDEQTEGLATLTIGKQLQEARQKKRSCQKLMWPLSYV
jgi:hypothetical protein